MNYVCIDGGGTKVQAARVKINSSNSIDIIEPIIERKYLDHKSYNPNFIPISIDDQKRNHPILDIESHQGMVIIKTILGPNLSTNLPICGSKKAATKVAII